MCPGTRRGDAVKVAAFGGHPMRKNRETFGSRPDRLKGRIVAGLYPAANYYGVRLRYEPRRLLVESVRVIRHEPIEAETLELDPMLKRGRVLITGLDLDKNAERSFYLESFVGLSVRRKAS